MNTMAPSGIITLITDFGLADPYVGIMKGVILGLNPNAKLIDITHELTPGDIIGAAMALKDSFAYFPEGTVHIVVVDPGVGTDRRPLAFLTDRYFFVAPDNGVLWPIISENKGTVIHLSNPSFFRHPISNTFHGRDIFAPVAAHISAGIDPLRMGKVINDPIRLTIPRPIQEGNLLKGQVVRIDRFGNLITNIDEKALKEFLGSSDCIVKVGPIQIYGISSTYADVPIQKELALVGSSGFLEISVNQGRADARLGIRGSILNLPVFIEKQGPKH